VIFYMAEVAVRRGLFAAILERFDWFGVPPPLVQRSWRIKRNRGPLRLSTHRLLNGEAATGGLSASCRGRRRVVRIPATVIPGERRSAERQMAWRQSLIPWQARVRPAGRPHHPQLGIMLPKPPS
jgi:hypothetical protein